jgi:hypothetical protein
MEIQWSRKITNIFCILILVTKVIKGLPVIGVTDTTCLWLYQYHQHLFTMMTCFQTLLNDQLLLNTEAGSKIWRRGVCAPV